jgi:hypothetical protein
VAAFSIAAKLLLRKNKKYKLLNTGAHKMQAAIVVLSIFLTVTASIAAAGCNVLVLMPSEAYLRLDGGRMVRVGSYLDETMVPLLALIRAGCEVSVATPQGTRPILDPRSNSTRYFSSDAEYRASLALWASLPALAQPLALAALAAADPESPVDAVAPWVADFDLLFVPAATPL